jgi:hypothetical protein
MRPLRSGTAGQAADDQRRKAEDGLFLGDLRQQDGDEPTAAYKAVAEHSDRLSEWLRLRDEVWSELPLLAEWHLSRLRLRPASAGSEVVSNLANDSLVDLIEQSVALDWHLKRLAKSRDDGGDFPRFMKTVG